MNLHSLWPRWFSRGPRVAALVAALVAVLAVSAASAAAVELDPRARADIARIEDYLNRLDTLQARFLQISSTGQYAEGNLFIWRPGRLRIEYDPPVPVLIVSNGTWLIYHDRELEQVSYVLIDSTLAGILVADDISFFSQDVAVTGFDNSAGVLRLTLVRAEDPLEGSLTLVFSDRPLVLRKWHITDAQGVRTTVSLLETRFGMPLNPELFRFRKPKTDGSRTFR